MKITNVEAIAVKQPDIKMIGDGSQDTVVIRVHTDEGITGISEVDSSPYVVKACVEAGESHMICRGLKDIIIGEDPFDVEKIWDKMYNEGFYYGRRSVGIHAMSGIDIALWDIMGKKLNMPSYKLLGGQSVEKIPAYCSILMPETEGEMAAIAERYRAEGFKWFKLGWGALGRDVKNDIRLIKRARKLLGDDVTISVDIGKRWSDYKMGLYGCDAMLDEDVYWLEEPFSPDNIDAYKRLCSATKMRISGGEELSTLYEYDTLINECKIDIVQPDMSRCGGLTVARKIAAIASLRGCDLIPHNFKSGVLMASALQILATLPHPTVLEYCCQETVLSKNLMKNHFKIDADGCVAMPKAPGLGIEIDEEILEKYRVAD